MLQSCHIEPNCKEVSEMTREFKTVDLHIHTPASEDYKGNKADDEEYLRILRTAKSRRLSIIAITDHNSIEGYRKMKDLQMSLSTAKTDYITSGTGETDGRLSAIERDLSLFQSILILPGVEMEVRYGIHILIIFNDTTAIDAIHRFIRDAGYNEADLGKKDTSTLQAWDIFALYEESKKHDCVLIDAHTDSTKGIWNTLAGQSRINALKSPQLAAVCYNSEAQRNNIQNLLETVREYKRDVPLSFIRCSDAHKPEAVGSPKTWVRLENVDFESLRQAFNNPSENIFSEEPSSAKILNRLIPSRASFGILDMSDSNMSYFEKLVCALNNTHPGHLLFGVSLDKKKVGLPIPKKDHEVAVDRIHRSLERLDQRVPGRIIIYPLQRDRIIMSVRISPSQDLVSVRDDGRVYVMRNGKLTTLSAHEVQRLVEARVTNDIAGKITKRLTLLERECRCTQYLVSSIPIIRKFEDNSCKAQFEPDVDHGIAMGPEKVVALRRKPHGTSRGNLLLVDEDLESPRLEDAYLRYTAPVFLVRKLSPAPKTRQTIYITQGGAAYYYPKDLPIYAHQPPVLKLHQSRTNTPYGIDFTICFLKSSLLMWYCRIKFDSVDIFLPDIFRNIRMPVIDEGNIDHIELLRSLSVHLHSILNLEKQFLQEYRKLLGDREKINDHIDTHNARVAEHAYRIDTVIYQLLRLSPDEIQTIEGYLELNSVYLPTPRPNAGTMAKG